MELTHLWNVAVYTNGKLVDRTMFGWDTTREAAMREANEMNRWCMVNGHIQGSYVAYPVPRMAEYQFV